jgi:hypothetical protein
MNRRLTYILVVLVTVVLVVAAVAFSIVVTSSSRADAESQSVRPAVPLIAHPAKDRMADCARCHASGRVAMPGNHATYGAGACLTCHRTGPRSKGKSVEGRKEAEPVPHPVALPYDDCVGCHAIGDNLGMPADHADYVNEDCTGCHTRAAAQGAGRADKR